MKKFLFAFIIFIIVVLIGTIGYFFLRDSTSLSKEEEKRQEVTYRCDNQEEIIASFSETEVSFTLSDGRVFTLLRVPIDGDDGKFSNRDGSVVLWTRDYSAFLEENDETTYTGCVVYPLSFPNAD